MVPAQTAAQTQLQTAKSLETPANGGGGQRMTIRTQSDQAGGLSRVMKSPRSSMSW